MLTGKGDALKITSVISAALVSAAILVLAVAGSLNPTRSAFANLISTAAQAQELTPEERMRRRFPQPAKVSHLIGLPVLDGKDRTIGYVENVVRTPDGKVRLIVPYSSWLGWPRHAGPLAQFRRDVAVPIENAVILGRQINIIDMDRPDFDKAPTWRTANGDAAIQKDDTILIGLGRR